MKPGQHAAVRPRAAGADDHVVHRDAPLEPLLQQLLHAGDVAEAADRVGAAERDHVGAAAQRRHGVGLRLHLGRQVGAGRDDAERLDAHQPEQEVVAGPVLAERAGHPLLDHEAAPEAFLHRRGQRDPAMVALRRAARDQRVGALRQRVGDQELELARLVAAGKQAELIVALDPDLGPAAVRALRRQPRGEARQRLERRGCGGVATAREAGQVHGCDRS